MTYTYRGFEINIRRSKKYVPEGMNYAGYVKIDGSSIGFIFGNTGSDLDHDDIIEILKLDAQWWVDQFGKHTA